MDVYPNPYLFPTFIDNHDMARFLSSGDVNGLKQALTTIFTIPGIPTIYQGTAQAMTETRTAMFKGGYGSQIDRFDESSELYQFISTLAKLRTSNKVLTRGDYTLIASDKNGPGLIAYARNYQGHTMVILMNTSSKSILVNRIAVSDQSASLKPIFGSTQLLPLTADGELTTELPGRAIIIAELTPTSGAASSKSPPTINLARDASSDSQIIVNGFVDDPKSPLLIVKNNQIETAISITPESNGRWEYQYPVKNLGNEEVSLVAYQPLQAIASDAVSFTTTVNVPEFELNVTDDTNHDNNLPNEYLPPQHSQSIGQQDILSANVKIGGDILDLTLTMKALTNDWIPTNGFDNVAFSIYFDIADKDGLAVLPFLNTTMPDDLNWDLGHVAYGWGNSTFSTDNSDRTSFGQKYGVAPTIVVDKAANTIRFRYNRTDFGIPDWYQSSIYVTTWDITGEGMYRKIDKDVSEWSFSVGDQDDPKVFDSMLIRID